MNYGRKSTSKRRRQLQPRSHVKKKRKNVRPFGVFLLCVLGLMILGLITGGILLKKIIDDTPQISANDLKPSAYTTTAYADDGTTVIGTYVSSGSNREFIAIADIPKELQDAFIAVEDTRFYKHKGVDVKGITRAFLSGITSAHFSQGGSTITQQLIKNSVFPNFSNETRWQKVERKVQELYLAISTERILDKEQILENYLNTINLGQNTLGVQSASKRYFGKSAKDLTLSESVTIAAITKSPNGYNPITNPAANAKRREKVLNDMLAQELITQSQYDEAIADDVYERIQLANAAYKENITVNSYFVDEVAKAVQKDLREKLGYSESQAYNAVYRGGLKIITTQNVTMQKICEEELNRAENYPSRTQWTVSGAITIHHADGTQKNYDHNTFARYVEEKYDVKYGRTFATQDRANQLLEEYIETLKTSPEDKVDTNISLQPQPQATMTIMDQTNGQVKAMVGGRGEKVANMSLNRATQSPRQPGSCFKVLSTYVPALDMHKDTLATIIKDAPLNYSNGKPVKNWWSGYRGDLTLRYCIEQSANVCTVRKYKEITPKVGYQYLSENFAFSTLDPARDLGEAVSLGGITNGVYNIELTAAYASIANKGIYTPPVLYTHIYDHDGNLLFENTPKTHVAMKETTAALITSAMQDVVNHGTGGPARLSNMPVAGKTGTTTSTRDLWFAGYTPYLTASIWSGFDDNQEIDGSASYHKVIWRKVMQRIVDTCKQKRKEFEMPEEGIIRRTICKKTGLLASSDTCEKYTEYFAEGTAPTKSCPGHIEDPNNPANGTAPNGTTGGTTGGTGTAGGTGATGGTGTTGGTGNTNTGGTNTGNTNNGAH